MPEDIILSQIGSSQLPPPFRGLYSPGVRKRCQIIFACYFRKSSVGAHSPLQTQSTHTHTHTRTHARTRTHAHARRVDRIAWSRALAGHTGSVPPTAGQTVITCVNIVTPGRLPLGHNEGVRVLEVGRRLHALRQLDLKEAWAELHVLEGEGIAQRGLAVTFVRVETFEEDVAHHLKNRGKTHKNVSYQACVFTAFSYAVC